MFENLDMLHNAYVRSVGWAKSTEKTIFFFLLKQQRNSDIYSEIHR